MNWSWEHIKTDWLLGGTIAEEPDNIVAAFAIAERLLGADWIDQHRNTPSGTMAGAAPTLAVVATGRSLAVVEEASGAPKLIARLKAGDRAAYAELDAIYLTCVGQDVELEIEPDLAVSARHRKPDFRVRKRRAEWLYVEVAAPDIAETQRAAESVIQTIASILPQIPKDTALDLFLRRDPSESEIKHAKGEMLRLGHQGIAGDYDLVFGVVSVNMSHPSVMEPRDFGAEPYTPRLGMARLESEGGEPTNKRVSVRYPYSDERAEAFLTSEAKQLSREAPGLVMLNLSRSVGSFKTWRPLLQRRLQPDLHTRVSGICLFSSGMETTNRGEDVVWHTSVIINNYARHRLPAWAAASLQRFERQHNSA